MKALLEKNIEIITKFILKFEMSLNVVSVDKTTDVDCCCIVNAILGKLSSEPSKPFLINWATKQQV